MGCRVSLGFFSLFFSLLLSFQVCGLAVAGEAEIEKIKPFDTLYSATLTFADGTPVNSLGGLGQDFKAHLLDYPPGYVKSKVVEQGGKKVFLGSNVPAKQAIIVTAVNKPMGRESIISDVGTGPAGIFFLKIPYPGTYVLKLADIDITEFEARVEDDHLVITLAPSAGFSLPFNYLISTTPEASVTLRENNGKQVEALPRRETGLYPLNISFFPPVPLVIEADAPGAGPGLQALIVPEENRKGDLQRRTIRVTPLNPSGVHQVVSDTFFNAWSSRRNLAEDPYFWLQVYDGKKSTGYARPISVPADVIWEKAQSPEIYLDETGELRAYFEFRDQDQRKKIGLSYRVTPAFRLEPVEDDYPLFIYKGMRIKGTTWMIPSFFGIPMQEGIANTLSLSCEFQNGGDSISSAFSFVYDRSVKGYQFEPKRIMPVFSSTVNRGDVKKCSISFRGTTFNDYMHKDPMTGKDCAYLQHPDESGYPSAEACSKAAWDRAPFYIGDGPDVTVVNYNGGINVIDSEDGTVWARGPLNVTEGPYPELRYEAVRTTRFATEAEAKNACEKPRSRQSSGRITYYCEEKYIQKVCLENYSWSKGEGRTIIPNFSALYCNAAGDMDIVVHAEAEGYKADERIVRTRAAVFSVSGVVRNTKGEVVPGAAVSLPDLGVSGVADSKGMFSLAIGGGGPTVLAIDFLLSELFSKIEASVELLEPVIANGRKSRIRIKMLADGKPYDKRQLLVIRQGVFEVKGKRTNLLEAPGHFSKKVVTDANGMAELELPGPHVVIESFNALADSRYFFPATGYLELRGDWAPSHNPTVSYDIGNPYPIIRQMTITGGIDEETWQLTPSRVLIDDADSTFFKISVEALGHLKIQGGPVMKNMLEVENAISPFTFHYKPPKMGFDLTNQPDLQAMLIETNLKASLNIILSVLENDLLAKGAFGDLVKSGHDVNIDPASWVMDGSITEALSSVKNGLSILDRTSDTINLVHGGPGASGGDAMIKTFDHVFGMAETAFGLIGPGAGTGMEAAKAVYENAKVFYNAFNQYENINNAYQDIRFIPVTVTVEDDLGHKTRKIGKCSVMVWTAVQ